jgi:hypothetical protein
VATHVERMRARQAAGHAGWFAEDGLLADVMAAAPAANGVATALSPPSSRRAPSRLGA